MKKLFPIVGLMSWCLTGTLQAAVLAGASFDDNTEDWIGAGSMTVIHSNTQGTPAADGALRGSFAAQGFFIPQTGSFRMNQAGSDFLGAYPGPDALTGFTFDFMADNVLPLYVNLRLFSGVASYFYTLDISSLAVDVWTPFTVSLSSPSWQGDASVLNNVTAIDVQVARGSSAQQYFFLDNFSTTSANLDGGGGGSAVPEPSTGVIMLYFGAVLYGMRKRVRRGRTGWRGTL